MKTDSYTSKCAKKTRRSDLVRVTEKEKAGFEEKQKLFPTELGRKIVEEFDKTELNTYFDIPYTANMECDLDKIANHELE